MTKVALVSHDVQTVGGRAGGVGAFVTHFAQLLTEAGEDVTIILARAETEPLTVDVAWRERYQAWGIHLIELYNAPPQPDRWPDVWPLRLSERVAPLLGGFNVVYFSDWANVAFHAVREKRFSNQPKPVFVTVLHGPSNWVRLGNRQYPRIPEDLHIDFIERYGARHSDFVVAPSRFMLDWLKREGWEFRAEPKILGLPYRPHTAQPAVTSLASCKRLIFFGRLETLKGFGLFVSALRQLALESPQILKQLEEIVLLGHEREPAAAERVRRELAITGTPVTHLASLDSRAAIEYLADHAGDALVVIPSPFENFPYAVIESSSIHGLNVICSRGGGIPEIFGGRGDAQLFEPTPSALAAKLVECLTTRLVPGQLIGYDFSAANERWLAFHRHVYNVKSSAHSSSAVHTNWQSGVPVDVCIPYYNKSRHFPQLLEALANQTATGFGVIAIDDGSPSTEARMVFDAMTDLYSPRGWRFLREANAFVDAARNRAAQASQAEYLFFVDADDIPSPDAIARLFQAAKSSGVDCVVSGGCLFEGDELPYDPVTGAITVPVLARYMPLGANLAAGLVDPIIWGPPMILIRRQVFEDIGGYREVPGAAHEDWELQIRLAMAGYEMDVIPEYLLFFRRLADGLASISDDFVAKRRIIETYEKYLAGSGLQGAATAMFALYRRCQELENAVRQNVPLDVRLRLHDRLRKLLQH